MIPFSILINILLAALIVRFLTKKYLPEYSHGNITCYERTIQMDDKEISVRIIDTPGKVSISISFAYVNV